MGLMTWLLKRQYSKAEGIASALGSHIDAKRVATAEREKVRRSSLAVIEGQAVKIQFRREGQGTQGTDVCAFRLQGFDDEGNAMAPVAVEIRSSSGFAGDLSELDRVAVYDDRSKGGFIESNAILNITTNAVFGDRVLVNHGVSSAPDPARKML